MSGIAIIGVDRPGLAFALRRHGLGTTEPPVAALVAAGMATPSAPTIVEARDADMAVALLGEGVDDVVLASDPDRLVAARLAALVRRSPTPRLALGDLAIDLVERRATCAGRPIALLPREYAMLRHLVERVGTIVSRAELTRDVLGLRFDPGTNVVAVHLSRLRAKLHAAGAPTLLTERGRGYRLAATPIAAGPRAV